MIKWVSLAYYLGLIVFLILCISILETINIVSFLGFSLKSHAFISAAYLTIFTHILKYLIVSNEENLSESDTLKLKKFLFFNYFFVFITFICLMLSTIFNL